MLKSMTGFGNCEVSFPKAEKVSVELRSTNHKFLEIVVHLPEGLLSLEEKIKSLIERKVKRGRITCVVNFKSRAVANAFVNTELLKDYLKKINAARKLLGIKDEVRIDTLLSLPGILLSEEKKPLASSFWPKIKVVLEKALVRLMKSRLREGLALKRYFLKQIKELTKRLKSIKIILKQAVRVRMKNFSTDEEKAAFLKNTDVSEELAKISFYIRSLRNKINSKFAVGKELDFIAQEMQREANTLAAKTFAVKVSAEVLKVKAIIEKIREQAQNVE